jgi:hypothetical protein
MFQRFKIHLNSLKFNGKRIEVIFKQLKLNVVKFLPAFNS